ncbi:MULTISPECIES: hypothetical protein [unclassified Microcoleus]|uniref:hypothetical protein n=1 Tax=unclassified Microcoleus TaxID=2642155 RepID=UPI002FCFB95E
MGKGVTFKSDSEGTPNYGWMSTAKIYTGQVAAATGLTGNQDIPSSVVSVPHRLQDLLAAGELKRITVVLHDGAGKRTNRTLYMASEQVATFRNPVATGGLIGATIDGKTVLSVSIPRKSSNRLA